MNCIGFGRNECRNIQCAFQRDKSDLFRERNDRHIWNLLALNIVRKNGQTDKK